MNGDFQGRLIFSKKEEKVRARGMGIVDLERVYNIEELASGNVMFCATGVTTGTFLDGVKFYGGRARTHSVVMRSQSGTVRYITAEHDLTLKKI